MIIGYDGGNKNLEIAFSTEEKELIEKKLADEKASGTIRGWSSYVLDDLKYSQDTTMSEALKNMDETAYNATKNLTDLDEAIAFYDKWL